MKKNASSFRSSGENTVIRDPLQTNKVNPQIQNGNFSQVSGGSLPTSSNKLTIVNEVVIGIVTLLLLTLNFQLYIHLM